MGPSFRHRRARALLLLAAVTVVTALSSMAAVQVASASKGKPPSGGQPPCPSCADRLPPPGSGGNGSGSGGSGGGTSGRRGGSGAGQAGSGPAAPLQPLISIDGITLNGVTASITGSVNVNASINADVGSVAAAAADINLTVNAKPISISASGDFTATANVKANADITVRALDVSAGVVSTITIPSEAIPGGGVEVDALAQLEADKVTLMLPLEGFTVIDGVGIDATVHVAATAGIAGLQLNGVDVLASLKAGASSSQPSAPSKGSGSSGSSGVGKNGPKPPSAKPGGGSTSSGHHSATAPVRGNAKSVSLKVTGANGATQTTTVPVRHLKSVIRLGRMVSVSAFGALGVKIASVKFDSHSVARTGKVGVTVTVRDRRHYLVRDAVVMLQPVANRLTIRSSWAGMTTMLGRAKFTIPVSSGMLGHRLYVRVIARTPRASTHVTSSAFLCGCG